MRRFIGDVHAKFTQYTPILEGCQKSLQIGDFGIGFDTPPTQNMLPNHRFIRGNHDNPTLCKEHPMWVPDGTMIDDVFCLGGAYSIDQHQRIPGRDWWHDEELTIDEFYQMMDRYEDLKPSIVATHDCPSSIADRIMKNALHSHEKHSRTRQALDSMLYIHRPDVWIFGHWHVQRDIVIDGTRFICLPELGILDL